MQFQTANSTFYRGAVL